MINVTQGNTTYTAVVYGNKLLIEQHQQGRWNGKRVYKIADDSTRKFTYQVQKTQVKAINAGEGIEKFLERSVQSGLNGMAFSFLNKVWENVKETK